WLGEAEGPDQETTIVVDDARVESFLSAWQSRMQRPPTQQELDGLINQYIREEIYYREAQAMGLGEDDPITRRRMAQKLEFLTKDVARLREPAEGELEGWFAQNIDDYRQPDLITFTQVFFDPDKRGDVTLTDAEDLLAELQQAGEPDEQVSELGDRFMLQAYYPQKSELDIRRQLGSGFAEAVMQLEPGSWHGPMLSGYGVHLVYVYGLQQAIDPEFAAVKDRVMQDWQLEQQESFNEEYFQSLKSRYDIRIEAELLSGEEENLAEASKDEVAAAL
ncbi:MAG: peptidyl-prolyl cis-trans isomerase, partial [Gammaproteobacteria bacterium]